MMCNEVPVEICSMHGCEMDGEYCPRCEAEINELLAEYPPDAKCSVCGIEWVDVAAGQDTCDGCQRG